MNDADPGENAKIINNAAGKSPILANPVELEFGGGEFVELRGKMKGRPFSPFRSRREGFAFDLPSVEDAGHAIDESNSKSIHIVISSLVEAH